MFDTKRAYKNVPRSHRRPCRATVAPTRYSFPNAASGRINTSLYQNRFSSERGNANGTRRSDDVSQYRIRTWLTNNRQNPEATVQSPLPGSQSPTCEELIREIEATEPLNPELED